MSVAETIEQKLRDRFTPTSLTVTDDSARHAGHAGAQPGGETHFRVVIVSPAFAGLGRVARQRLVYETLAGEISDGSMRCRWRPLPPASMAPRIDHNHRMYCKIYSLGNCILILVEVFCRGVPVTVTVAADV